MVVDPEKFLNKVYLSLQWHITTNCSNRCKHCYVYDEKTYHEEKNNILPLDGLVKILDDLKKFEKKYHAKFDKIVISGGDPLLREDIYEFIEEVNKLKTSIHILGNPETLNKKAVLKLKELNISHFQMSLDGLEKTHDFFRSKGSFKRTVEKTKLLKEHGFKCNIMFTLFPSNAQDLIPLMNFVAKNTYATSFSLDVGCYVGEGKNLPNNFTPEILKKIFSNYLREKNKLENKYAIKFAEKSNYHKITRLDNNLLTSNHCSSTSVISGCLIGWQPPSILSDGTTLICRHLPISSGKLPKEGFEKIFLGNLILKKFRRKSFFTGCKDCDLYCICRGCPANVYSLKKDPFLENPFCFRKNLKKEIKPILNLLPEPDLNTTYEEEWNLIKKHLIFKQNSVEFLNDKEFQYIYLELSQHKKLKEQFLKAPMQFISNKKYKLTEDMIAWLKYRFSEQVIHNNYNFKNDPFAKEAYKRIVNDILAHAFS